MTGVDPFHRSLIEALGGKAKVAGALGLGRSVLTKWHERGIPSRYWHKIIELAASFDIEVTAEALERHKPPTRSANSQREAA